jgi:hypothetical protein
MHSFHTGVVDSRSYAPLDSAQARLGSAIECGEEPATIAGVG